MRTSHSSIVLFFLVVLVGGATLASDASDGKLGTIDFPNSGAPDAQDAFIRGVLLLHSFEYEDARDAFQQARAIDPNFALAYWGEAMTYNHPLWRRQEREDALEALERFAPSPAERRRKTQTERERGYLQAVELLYGTEGWTVPVGDDEDADKIARDLAYSKAMGRLAARYSDDLEARAFYALSILGTAQGVRDERVYMRAGAVAEEVFAANRLHPGAVHYMIHSYDDPVHAPLGLRAARVYAQIAPAAAHAQHMISHIYVALGDWADSVEANVKSFEVSADRRQAKELGVDALNYHALHWLAYSYQQLGRFDEAKAKLDMMTEYARESRSPRALWYHAAMRAGYVVETGGAEAPDEIDPILTQVTGAAADLFASGYAALRAGDRDRAALYADKLDSRYATAAAGELCSLTGGYESTSKRDLVVAEVLQNSLRALIAFHDGKADKAIALFEQATAAEEAMALDFGPPIIVKPSHELYGEMLLEMGQPAAAQIQFEKALRRAPRRSRSLAGLAAAARANGDTDAYAKSCAEIDAIYVAADESVREVDACGEAATRVSAAAR